MAREIRISLSGKDFEILVRGGIVGFRGAENIDVKIALQDIGYPEMRYLLIKAFQPGRRIPPNDTEWQDVPHKYLIGRNEFGRVIIVHPSETNRAWSGSRWVEIGGNVQICNFKNVSELDEYMGRNDVEIAMLRG